MVKRVIYPPVWLLLGLIAIFILKEYFPIYRYASLLAQVIGGVIILAGLLLLVTANVFMTFAWYAHLKELGHKPWLLAALVSWGIALFEYLLQVPANRIGYTVLTVAQLKILQEVITLTVFVPFALLYLKEPLKLDYLWAGLCMLGAVYFMFRGR